MLIDRINDIDKIIDEPIHGRKFYSEKQILLLKKRLTEIYELLDIKSLETKEIVYRVLEYMTNNVLYKKSYFDFFSGKSDFFDKENLKYRTAYGALVEGEAMCAGYAESIRILLSIYGIKSYTIISKLPLERKKMLHYVVVVKNGDSDYIVLDPESEQYCKKNNLDYTEYMENSLYMIPEEIFTNDVVGIFGAGILAEDYLKCNLIPAIQGTKKINELIDKIDNMGDLKLPVVYKKIYKKSS